MNCPMCDSTDVHKSTNRLKCDECGYESRRISGGDNIQTIPRNTKNPLSSSEIDSVESKVTIGERLQKAIKDQLAKGGEFKTPIFTDKAVDGQDKTVRYITNFEPHSVSLLANCPECGSANWKEDGRKEDGSVCKHYGTMFAGIRGTHD